MPSMQSDRNGHWSHLSDLPSKGAPLECTTICDTCYLKQLLIHIRMILMCHNENVTSPILHNKDKHCTDISTPHIRVIICTPLYKHADTLVCQRSTRGRISDLENLYVVHLKFKGLIPLIVSTNLMSFDSEQIFYFLLTSTTH